jgi:1,4-dihydroxy-2-naphthoate octaprenyltransferase
MEFHQTFSCCFPAGSFLLYALGTALAVQSGREINWAAYVIGQLLITSIQLMGQYLNEHYDMEVDSLVENNRTWFSGGSGILSEGSISPGTVLKAARICAGVALIAGTIAFFLSVWMIPIFILCFLGSWFYSSPPLSLMSSGWLGRVIHLAYRGFDGTRGRLLYARSVSARGAVVDLCPIGVNARCHADCLSNP